MTEERVDWASMDRDEAVRKIMGDLGVSPLEAEEILKILTGHSKGHTVLKK